ncbi:MAG: hypothetical protein R2793_03770 [Flavobacteriaceae bacterium]
MQYKNIPNEVVLATQNAKEISFEVKGNGFQLLSHLMKNNELDIDIAHYYQDGDTLITVSNQELQAMVSSQLKLAPLGSISENGLTIHLDRNATKKVKVTLLSEITYKEGFLPNKDIYVTPDSVLLSGPSELIDTISKVTTRTFKKKNLSESIHESVPIQNFKSKKVLVTPSDVLISLEVEEFTQMRMTVPVEVIHVPEGTKLQLFPSFVEIAFDVSVTNFDTLSEKDFKLVCDFSEVKEDENFMTPKLILFPDNVQRVQILTNKVEFLIFK